ncbi:lipoprotein NlpI [Actinobacillus succinogenes]|uniref:Lipoprotein NlpI n=1 Tax=Actinobacillus succinogenes (strain ATCC 55618 / DSM 22257 / CCUG 43843 / 130Z) TaxID=339671 RepID=A6VR09_ACTSZ|nr:lipoprotein NlpI [Actinobacillus succinogenes]ABR75406.1 Tetratricopeptide TPR_2 repeat protein [Actinobacillus succinogenes 130Z]PHI40206.1 lipoprotein NlpI [Actinobacillus succinogenes]
MAHLKRFLNVGLFIPGLFVLLLAGCTSSTGVFVSKNKIVLAEQYPNVHFEQEVMIARISQILIIGQMSHEERADLHFERGVLYDSLGLWGMARYDFTHALALQPRMAAVYNYLGLYSLLDEDYDSALESFNVVLELDPDYEYTYLNRGLDFYYTGRYNLAAQDFHRFYQANIQDPYRVLWIYLNELKFKPSEARQNLVNRAETLSTEYWGTFIVQYYLGKLSEQDLLDKAKVFVDPQSPEYAEILTETYFYLAKQKLNTGDLDEAETLFKLAVANQVYNFVEYRFALFELDKLKKADAGEQTEPMSDAWKAAGIFAD